MTTQDNIIEWQYEFRGKRYGNAISKGTVEPGHPIMNDPKCMHGWIDMMAKQMHETLDAIVKKEDSK